MRTFRYWILERVVCNKGCILWHFLQGFQKRIQSFSKIKILHRQLDSWFCKLWFMQTMCWDQDQCAKLIDSRSCWIVSWLWLKVWILINMFLHNTRRLCKWSRAHHGAIRIILSPFISCWNAAMVLLSLILTQFAFHSLEGRQCMDCSARLTLVTLLVGQLV